MIFVVLFTPAIKEQNMSEQNYAGQLVETTYPITGPDSVKPVMLWHYEAPDRHCLPELFKHDRAVALVNNELIYVHHDGTWSFNLEQTNLYHALFKKPGVSRSTEPTNPVAGIEHSSKPRSEWTMGNWIAHVGGDIRSDHFVVFGSVMAVDMMVRQIIRNVLGLKKEGVNISLSGGTEKQRLMLATAITGALEPITVNPGYNLKKFVDSQAENMLSFEQTVVIMDAIEASGGVNLEVVADKAGE